MCWSPRAARRALGSALAGSVDRARLRGAGDEGATHQYGSALFRRWVALRGLRDRGLGICSIFSTLGSRYGAAARQHTAVDRERGPRNPPRLSAGQKQDRLDDILRLAVTAQRMKDRPQHGRWRFAPGFGEASGCKPDPCVRFTKNPTEPLSATYGQGRGAGVFGMLVAVARHRKGRVAWRRTGSSSGQARPRRKRPASPTHGTRTRKSTGRA